MNVFENDFNGIGLVLPERKGIKNKKGTAPALGCTQM
jgi:hypothetical protein